MYGFPVRTVEECKRNLYNFRSDTFVMSNLVFVVLDLLNFQDVFGTKDRVAIYIRRDLCLIVDVKDEDESIRKLFEDTVKRYETEGQGIKETVPEKFLYHFLDI